MKKYFKHIFAGVLAAFALTACVSEYDYTPGEAERADAENKCAYFAKASDKYEIEPGTINSLPVTVCRANTQGAVEIPLVMKEGDADVWTIPATVSFADGEDTKQVEVQFANIPEGETRELVVALDPAYIATYGNVGTNYDYKVSVSLVKWVKGEGCGYWIDAFLSSVFTSFSPLPIAVEYEKAELPSGEIRYRFASPYAVVSPNDGENLTDDAFVQLDENPEHVAFVGYPYTEDGDLTGNAGTMLITVNGKNAKLNSFLLGIDYGYGEMQAGTIYGVLSDDLSRYPLGVAEIGEKNTTITFGESSLYCYLPDAGTFVNKTPGIFTTDPAVVVEMLYADEEPGEEEELTYSPLFRGIYTHAVNVLDESGEAMWTEATNTVMSEDWVVYACDQDKSRYMLKPFISSAGAMTFTTDGDGMLNIETSPTGYTYGETQLPILAGDITLSTKDPETRGYFDSANGTLVFNLLWIVVMENGQAGMFGATQDTFVITEQVSSVRAMKPGNAGKKKMLRRDKVVAPKLMKHSVSSTLQLF